MMQFRGDEEEQSYSEDLMWGTCLDTSSFCFLYMRKKNPKMNIRLLDTSY